MQIQASSDVWWGRPWTEVLTAIGTVGLALLAFITIAVAAVRTRAERRRAKSNAGHDASRMAAERLNRTIFDYWRIVTLAAPGSTVDLTDFLMQVSIAQPSLDDAALIVRVENLAHAFVQLAGFIQLAPSAVVHGEGSYSAEVQREVGRWYRVRLDYTQVLARQTTWVGQSLAAHQVDRALPAAEASAALPPLTIDDIV